MTPVSADGNCLMQEYEPGSPIRYRLRCTNVVCPHVDIVYEVDVEKSAKLVLKRVTTGPQLAAHYRL